MDIIKSVENLANEFGVTIIVAKIMGRRWAFTENPSGTFSIGISKKIPLNDSWGVVVYNWNNLAAEKQIELENRLTELNGIHV